MFVMITKVYSMVVLQAEQILYINDIKY